MHISKCNDTMRFDVAVSFHPTSLFLSLIYYLPGKIAPLCEGIKSLRASINDLYVKEHRLAKISQAFIYALPSCLSAIIDDLNLNFMLWYVRTFHLFSTPRFSHLKVHTRLLLSATGFLFEYPISLFLSPSVFLLRSNAYMYSIERTNERNTFTILTVFVIGSHNTHSIKIFPFSHTHKYITTYYNFRQSLDILLRITICSSTKRNNNWKPISKHIHTFPIADAAIVVVQPFSFGIVSNEHSHIGFLVLIFYCCVAMCVSVWVCVSFDDRS